jgi:glycosyltransferase involved in cell wall biosynthesis
MVKMNILQVFDFFSLSHGGGTVDILYHLSKRLSNRGHNVVLYTSDFKLDRDYIKSLAGVKVYPFHSRLDLAGLHVMPGIISESKKSIREFDVIHMHCFRSFPNLVLHHYATKSGIPYIVDAHGSAPRMTAGRKGPLVFSKWLYDVLVGYRILRDAGKLVAETQVGADEYIELGAPPEKITLIHPPVDAGEFSELPSPGMFRQKQKIGDRKVVMFLGRINWIKGIDFLVDSFALLAKQMQDVVLVIVGSDDGYKRALGKRINDLGIQDRVLFTGFLGGTDKLSALVDADVLVQPSIYEQGARPSLEAILCDTPVIVSRNTGAGEDIREMDAGYLVDHGDTEGLRDALQYIIDNPDEAGIKTQKAKEYIRTNLSLAAQTEKYENLYREVIENNKGSKS